MLDDALSPEGVVAITAWVSYGLSGLKPPPPILLQGGVAEEIGRGLIAGLIHAGFDALVAPASWWRPGGSLPQNLPRIVAFIPGLEPWDDRLVDELADRCALICCGDVLPSFPDPGCRWLLPEVPRSVAADLQLLDDAGWPRGALTE